MYLLVGKSKFTRRKITHRKTLLMTMPFIAVEVLILLIFTFVDPNKETVILTQGSGSDVEFRVVCAHETAAFFAVQLTYEGGLLLIGCVLAFKTRNMSDQFGGESKQLIVAMYNIALVASVVLIVANVVEAYNGTIRVFVTVAICWCTVFSSGVFVLPRLLRVRAQQGNSNRRVTLSRGTSAPVLRSTALNSNSTNDAHHLRRAEWKSCAAIASAIPESESEDVGGSSFHKEAPF